MNIIIFEDHNIKNLNPFSINHSSFELKCGVYSNLERIVNSFDNDTNYYLIVRNELKELIQERFPRCTVNPKEIPKGFESSCNPNIQAKVTAQEFKKIENETGTSID